MATQFDKEALIREHHIGVWRYLRFLGSDRSSADDLTQETFLVFLKKPFNFQGRAATASYLRNIARLLRLEAVKSTRKVKQINEADAVFEQEVGDDDGQAYLEALQHCLNQLTERARSGLQLQFKDRLALTEIAERIKMKPNGVKTLLQRARASLRACIERRVS
ncbi:MAG: RNA polymerase sigma factor [Planctomycetota bacterium]|jgi:RNA polymerase sigma-70 factor (ECF subfamily)